MGLGIARDTMQLRIGEYLTEVKRVRLELKERRAPRRVLARFDELEELTTRHLIDDLTGDEPGD